MNKLAIKYLIGANYIKSENELSDLRSYIDENTNELKIFWHFAGEFNDVNETYVNIWDFLNAVL